jgi:hypothetical protein
LRLFDEAQAAQVVGPIASDAALALRLIEQPFALIETNSFDAHSTAGSKLPNGE